MVELFGKKWSQVELLQRVGDVTQLGGARLITFADGPEAGVRAAEVRLVETVPCGYPIFFVVLRQPPWKTQHPARLSEFVREYWTPWK